MSASKPQRARQRARGGGCNGAGEGRMGARWASDGHIGLERVRVWQWLRTPSSNPPPVLVLPEWIYLDLCQL